MSVNLLWDARIWGVAMLVRFPDRGYTYIAHHLPIIEIAFLLGPLTLLIEIGRRKDGLL